MLPCVSAIGDTPRGRPTIAAAVTLRKAIEFLVMNLFLRNDMPSELCHRGLFVQLVAVPGYASEFHSIIGRILPRGGFPHHTRHLYRHAINVNTLLRFMTMNC